MRLALFDFDGTLTTRDSLMPFLRHVVGTPQFVARLLSSSGTLLSFALGRTANDVAKERVIARFLQGRAVADLRTVGEEFAARGVPRLMRPRMLQVLRGHREAGDVCVLVSASLDLYLSPWAARQGFDAVLCSRLAEDAAGRVTGALVPRNCHGAEKRRRIEQWLAGRQPEHITAYGDSRGDWEMLALADAPHWMGKPPRDPNAGSVAAAAGGTTTR